MAGMEDATPGTSSARRPSMGLGTQILIGMVLGSFLGAVLGDRVTVIQPGGDLQRPRGGRSSDIGSGEGAGGPLRPQGQGPGKNRVEKRHAQSIRKVRLLYANIHPAGA